MSDNRLQLLPVDPTLCPNPLQRGRSLGAFRRLVPDASEVVERYEKSVVFVDAGENFESIRCSACQAEIAIDWWKERMHAAGNANFEDLRVTTPCCNRNLSLNDLDYTWPQGFARWYIDAMNPNRPRLTRDEISSVEAALGEELREVWTHY